MEELIKSSIELEGRVKKVVVGEHTFYLGDVLEVLDLIEDNSIDLVFTSPPYNVGIEYESHFDFMPYDEYLKWMEKIVEKIYRKVKDDGRFVINISPNTVGEYKPLFLDISNICIKVGFRIRDDIIWNKSQISKRTAWGSFSSPSDPRILRPYEYVLVFDKKYKKHKGKRENIDITKEEFVEFSNGLWNIKPETRKEILEACPAPFPEELAYRVIKFYTFVNDLVLDPFGGSGTTNKVCAENGRRSIYIDNSKKSFEFAVNRVKEVLAIKKITEFLKMGGKSGI